MRLDHIAVAAETLEAGCAYVENTLGARLSLGGQHKMMGTHNRLLGLADGLYLEVIAIDPSLPGPDRPRWFDLDRFSGTPRLTNWICRTNDIKGALAALPGAGRSVPLARGDLRWQMAIPDDGVLPFDNCLPALIEWEGTAHPVDTLPQSGIELSALRISHPNAEQLDQSLAPHLADPRVSFHTAATPCIEAEFETPAGPKVLR